MRSTSPGLPDTGRRSFGNSLVTRTSVLLAGILLVAFGLRLWGIQFGLPQKYHIDEPSYIVAALRIAQLDLHIEYPFNSPNIYQYILTFEYGLLFIVGRLAGVFHSPVDVGLYFEHDPTLFYVLARATSAIFGCITVAAVYKLGQLLRDTRTGLLAAAFLAVAFLHVRDSHFAVPDSLISLCVSLCLLGSALFLKTGSVRQFALAGFTAGLAIGLRYLPASVLVAPLAALLAQSRSLPPVSAWRVPIQRLALLAGCVAMGYLVAFPALLFDWGLFQVQLRQAFTQAANALGGVETGPGSSWVFYLNILSWGLGLPLLLAALGGAGLCLARRRWIDVLLAGTFVVYFAGLSVVSTRFARYILPLIPLLMVMAAVFVATVADTLTVPLAGLPRRILLLLAASGAVLILFYPVVSDVRFNWLLTKDDTRTEAKAWIEATIPDGAKIAMDWPTHGPALSTAQKDVPQSQRVYDVTIMSGTGLSRRPIAWYREQGFDYVIASSFTYEMPLLDKQRDLDRDAFYASLGSEFSLVHEVRPNKGPADPPFVFDEMYGPFISLWQRDLLGPVLKIYQVR